jgi:hypothetical protein
MSGGVVSAWSSSVCTTPREDPYPPRIELGEQPERSVAGDVTIPLRLEDTDGMGDTIPRGADMNVLNSRGIEIRYWFANELPSDRWQFFTETLQLTVPQNVTSVRIQARDGAGNISNILPVPLPSLSRRAQPEVQRR